MAGKSSRGRNKKGSQNNTAAAAPSAPVPAAAVVNPTEQAVVSENGHSNDNNLNIVEEQKVDANGVPPSVEIETAKPEVTDSENASSEGQVKQGDINLFPVPVKTQFGENLELQFLLDAPETCFFTCYDLLLHIKDGSPHHLEDYHEILTSLLETVH